MVGQPPPHVVSHAHWPQVGDDVLALQLLPAGQPPPQVVSHRHLPHVVEVHASVLAFHAQPEMVQFDIDSPWQAWMFSLLSHVEPALQALLQLWSQTHRPRVGSHVSPVPHAPPQVGSASHRPVTSQNPPLALFQTQPGAASHVMEELFVTQLSVEPTLPHTSPVGQAQPGEFVAGQGQPEGVPWGGCNWLSQ